MSQKSHKVLIVDDEPERSAEWAAKISSFDFASVDARALSLKESQDAILIANERRAEIRNGRDPFDGSTQCVLDDADVLVVDYDLQALIDPAQWSTGLQVVTLARAFTKAKAIVLVNQFGTNSFDLTLTKAIPSHADIDVGSGQITNPALWDPKQARGFAPWSWADGLLSLSNRIETTVDWMRERLDSQVIGAFGFTTDVDKSEHTNYLQPEIWQECLSSPTITFREMVAEAQFLTSKDREFIRDLDESCARVAAAIITHWLDRLVIPSNQALMDLPHLAAIYPWLLNDRTSEENWQMLSGSNALEALLDSIRGYLFHPGFPLSRPTVWRHSAMLDPKLAEPQGFTYDGFPDLVFCEDVSRFALFEHSRSFSSKLFDPDPQRFVSSPEISVKVRESVHFPTDSVAYEPAVLFAI